MAEIPRISGLPVPVYQLCVLLFEFGLEIGAQQTVILQLCHLLLKETHLEAGEQESATQTGSQTDGLTDPQTNSETPTL